MVARRFTTRGVLVVVMNVVVNNALAYNVVSNALTYNSELFFFRKHVRLLGGTLTGINQVVGAQSATGQGLWGRYAQLGDKREAGVS